MLGLGAMRSLTFRGRPSGVVLAQLLPCFAAVSLALPIAGLMAGNPQVEHPLVRPCCSLLTDSPRRRIEEQLRATPGRDLVLYRFDPQRDRAARVFVANHADIDSSEIVWAHDLGPANQRLFDYYPGRRVWLVDGSDAGRAVPFASDLATTSGATARPSAAARCAAPMPGASRAKTYCTAP